MGERPSKICESVGRSRVWLQKWIGRYDNSDKNSKKEWFRDKSRAPKNVNRKTDPEMEQLVVNARKSLMKGETEDTKYRCIGAVEVQLHMHELGHSEDEMPSLSTIKRIIKRNGLVVRKKKQYIRRHRIGATMSCPMGSGIDESLLAIHYGIHIKAMAVYQNNYQFVPFGRIGDFF